MTSSHLLPWTLLLLLSPLTVAVRTNTEEELTISVNETSDLDDPYSDLEVGCYCKKVEEESQCLDNKHSMNPTKPSGPRFFHPQVQDKKFDKKKPVNLCCKLDWTSFFSFVGFSYKRQDDLERCMSEVREVPSDNCCRMTDKYGSFGLRIKKAKSEMVLVQNSGRRPKFLKSPPEFDLADITVGVDYNGEVIEMETVHEFVQMHLDDGRFNDKLQCGGPSGSFETLFKDKGTCVMRTGPSQQCCCHVASLIKATRCLPADGAADKKAAHTYEVDLKPSYKEYPSHGYKEGGISGPPGLDPEHGMVNEINNVVDPEMEDIPETVADETQMVWQWVKAPNQWKKSCLEYKSIPYVISKKMQKRVPNGRTCHKYGRGPMVCRTKYKTKRWTEYSQGHNTKCVKWQYERFCPAGQGRYIKAINKGQCVQEPHEDLDAELALTDLGSLMYECPNATIDYMSGNPGVKAFEPMCQCEQKCT